PDGNGGKTGRDAERYALPGIVAPPVAVTPGRCDAGLFRYFHPGALGGHAGAGNGSRRPRAFGRPDARRLLFLSSHDSNNLSAIRKLRGATIRQERPS